MARLQTPTDAHTILNALAYQATGRTDLTATDTSSFVSVGETVLSTGVENVASALSIVVGKTLIGIKKYTAKVTLLQEMDTGLYTSRVRKISFYDKDAKESGWVNTNTHAKNLYNGYDNGTNSGNSVGSMWEQDKPIAIEFNFGGSDVWDFEISFYEDQLKAAFRNEDEFIAFWNGTIMQKENEIEEVKEQFNRMTLINYIAGIVELGLNQGKMPLSVVNITKVYNDEHGTTLTNAQLLSATYLKGLLETLVSEFKLASDFMEERGVNYHWSPSKTVDGTTYTALLRHTPKADQRFFYYKPLIEKAKAVVMPEIFNPEYLAVEQGEGVTYWQSNKTRMQIYVKPAIPNTSNPAEQTYAANAINVNVLGVLFDKDACITNFQFNGADTTPIEARKKYRNTWYHNAKNSINDFTENGIVFIMDDSYLAAEAAAAEAAAGGEGAGSGT